MDDVNTALRVIVCSFFAGICSAAVYGLTGWRLFEVISIACATACLLCIGWVMGKDG